MWSKTTEVIVAVILVLYICSTQARSLVSSDIHTTQLPCTGLLCHITKWASVEKESELTKSAAHSGALSRQKRGDSDVKIAEYMAWIRLHHPNCEDIACGLIRVINSDSKRKRRSAPPQATINREIR